MALPTPLHSTARHAGVVHSAGLQAMSSCSITGDVSWVMARPFACALSCRIIRVPLCNDMCKFPFSYVCMQQQHLCPHATATLAQHAAKMLKVASIMAEVCKCRYDGCRHMRSSHVAVKVRQGMFCTHALPDSGHEDFAWQMVTQGHAVVATDLKKGCFNQTRLAIC